VEISTFSWFFLVGRLNVTMANHASVTLMGFSAAVVSGFDLGCMDVFLERASARARARGPIPLLCSDDGGGRPGVVFSRCPMGAFWPFRVRLPFRQPKAPARGSRVGASARMPRIPIRSRLLDSLSAGPQIKKKGAPPLTPTFFSIICAFLALALPRLRGPVWTADSKGKKRKQVGCRFCVGGGGAVGGLAGGACWNEPTRGV